MKTSGPWLFAALFLCACGTTSEEGSGQRPALTVAQSAAATQSSPAPAREPSAKEAVDLSLRTLGLWVEAQNKGNADSYLALYDAPTFRGVTRTASGGEEKLTFDAWKEKRTRMLKTGITVAAESPKTVSWVENPGLGAGVVEIRFTQRWKNRSYADHGPKVLHFRVSGGAARIVYEELISSSPGWDDSPAADPGAQKCVNGRSSWGVTCQLKDDRVGYCEGATCKDVCGAGYSYFITDTRCHQYRDCPSFLNDSGEPVKTPRCNECWGMWCMDPDASRDTR